MNHDWERVRKLVTPELRDDPHEYASRVNRGLIVLRESGVRLLPSSGVPDTTAIKAVHLTAFHDVYPFAGEFRSPGEDVVIGGVHEAPFSTRIDHELERAGNQCAAMLEASRSEPETARALAFYHAQFERVHPFRDGNGRVGRVILASQVQLCLGRPHHPIRDKDAYLNGLREFDRTGDLRILSDAALRVSLPKQLAKVPFRRDLWPAEIDRQLPNGQILTLECPSLAEARRFSTAPLSQFFLRQLAAKGTGRQFAIDYEALMGPHPRLELSTTTSLIKQASLQLER